MGKNDARSQIPAPVVRAPQDAPPPPIGDGVGPAPAPLPPQYTPPPDPPLYKAKESALPAVPTVSELAARAITDGAGMAREYAAAAGELCRTANTNPQAGKNVRRLLRLALAHLET